MIKNLLGLDEREKGCGWSSKEDVYISIEGTRRDPPLLILIEISKNVYPIRGFFFFLTRTSSYEIVSVASWGRYIKL